MNLVLGFIAGAFITNGIPHFVSGIRGDKHMTPLAKDSSAMVNVVWAFVNFVIGGYLFNMSGGNLAGLFSFDSYAIAVWAGSFVMAVSCAWLFSNPNAGFPWFKK